jgi:hypothetical protein
MPKYKYNDNSLMPKTRKNVKTGKGKTSKTKDLEDLIGEDLIGEDLIGEDLIGEEDSVSSKSDTDSDSDADADSDSESESESETSMSKELNKMMNETMGNVKDGDLMMPAVGLGLIAIIGFALYKGINVNG